MEDYETRDCDFLVGVLTSVCLFVHCQLLRRITRMCVYRVFVCEVCACDSVLKDVWQPILLCGGL